MYQLMSPLRIRWAFLLWLGFTAGCQMTPNIPEAMTLPNPSVKVKSTQGEVIEPSQSVMLLQAGELKAAEPLLRSELQDDPGNLASRTNLAILLARTGRGDDAKGELTRVLKQRDYCPALLQMARLQTQSFDIKAAEHSYLVCLKAEPDHAQARLHLGILSELYLGDFDQAIYHYEMYQKASLAPEQRVANWIADLNRRIASAPGANQIAEVTP